MTQTQVPGPQIQTIRVFSLCGLLLAFAVGCPAVVTVPDSGPGDSGTVDAGTHDSGPVDSGPMDVDSGTDAGTDAGPQLPTISLSIAANPNSVLSAVATLTWTGPVDSVKITYSSEADAGFDGETPTWTLSSLTSPQTLPVLALHADTAYSFVAVGTEADAGTLSSTAATLTTGALPSGFPRFTVTTADGGNPAPGYTLVAVLPASTAVPDYETIIDETGYPVWYIGANPSVGGDFQQQPDGTFTLAQTDPNTHITGLMDTITLYHQYDTLGNEVRAPWQALNDATATPPLTILGTDDHEIRILDGGDALLYGFDEMAAPDLTDAGGQANSTLIGHVLERVTPNDTVAFAWDSLAYLDPAKTDSACTNINTQFIDFPHANAIDVDPGNGNYVLSMRNLSQIIEVDKTDGHIVWKLGGMDGQFTFPMTGAGADPLQGFRCQHGPRVFTGTDGNLHVIMFDDGNGHPPVISGKGGVSRGVEYSLDMTNKVANLVWSAEDNGEYGFILGYAQRLSNGDTLVAFGTGVVAGTSSTRNVDEFDQNGNVVWELKGGNSFGIYRAYRIDSLYGP